MTPHNLSSLLQDAADAVPPSDLAPSALRGARRRQVTRGVLAAAATVPLVALIAGLVLVNRPMASPAPLAPTVSASATASPTPTGTPTPTSTPIPTSTPAPTEARTPSEAPTKTKTATPNTPPTSAPSVWGTTSAYDIPASVGLTDAEATTLLGTLDGPGTTIDYRRVPPAWGMTCNRLDHPDPLTQTAARSWRWGAKPTSTFIGDTLDVVVTGWQEGAAGFQLVKANDGTHDCIIESMKVVSSSADSLEYTAAYGGSDGLAYLTVVRRVNNMLVSVTYMVVPGENPSAKAAAVRSFADLVAKRVTAAGLDKK